ncbi:MAG: PAS domain-containing protein [Chitinophagaceae bacterium]
MALSALSHINSNNRSAGNNGYPGKPITDTISNGFFAIDKKWKVTYWNKTAEELLGVKAKDIIGKNLWEKFAGIIPIDFYPVYHMAFRHDIPMHFKEYWGEIGDWFDVFAYYYDDTLSVSFKRSRVQAAEAVAGQGLKTLNELYKFVTEVTNDCLWEWDLENKEIFWIDGGHNRVFGYPIQNTLIPEIFWISRIHPDDKDRVITRLNKIIKEAVEYVWVEEYRFKKADGSYANVHDRGHIIYEGDKATRMIGATQDISDRKLLEEKLAEEKKLKHREITEAVLSAQEKERATIGRELHENINQVLAVAKLYIQMVQKGEKEPEKYLEDCAGMIQHAIDEIRKISRHLIIPPPGIVSLFENIRNLIDSLNAVHPIKIEFHTDGVLEKDLDEKLQLNIFRIVQEQVNNILKHADASKASINITRTSSELEMLITDNGKGFNIAEKRNGVGITNIISRAELCNGKAEIKSIPGKGFGLKVLLPLTAAI